MSAITGLSDKAKRMRCKVTKVILFAMISPALIGAGVSADNRSGLTPTEENLKVAFIADSGSGEFFRSVLRLIKRRGADMVLHQGDLGYSGSDTTGFMSAVDEILGPDFPYFASRGNHDTHWDRGYQPVLSQRAREAGAICSGDYGLNSACLYRGLFFILSGAGETGSETDNARYIEDSLAADKSIWRVCAWHRNQRAMQVGDKTNEVGWAPYEACRRGGAIIATGHGHHYARTRSLMNVRRLQVYRGCDTPAGDELCVIRDNGIAGQPGVTFVFVSGLGGAERRRQRRCTSSKFPYGQGRRCKGIWGNIYSLTQGASHGALFVTFNIRGEPDKAIAEFVNVQDEVIDSFSITSRANGSLVSRPTGRRGPGVSHGTGTGHAANQRLTSSWAENIGPLSN